VIIGYTALHYGSPYLSYAIRSIIDAVDMYFILYAAQPSHGTRVNGYTLPDSESRYNLYLQANEAAGDKLAWIDGDWTAEGVQRDSIHTICPNAEAVLVLDYDEIWQAGVAREVIELALAGDKWGYRMNMIHYWRSFRRAVLHDPAYPVRVIVPGRTGEGYLHTAPINHMGYAIPTWLLDYKLAVHGHVGQLRHDGWRENKWLANAQQDCHPIGSEYWNPETIEPIDYLPSFMQNHPYWTKEIIE